jgi:hypothetical protein
MNDQAGGPPRDRSGDAGRRTPDAARQVSRSRLPLPPVPAAAARPGVPRPPAGPRTTAAPFAAVPSPEPRFELDLDGAFPAAGGRAADRSSGSAPAIARPSRARIDAEPALASTGPSAAGGFRSSPLPPRVPRQTGPTSAPSPAYGDWTKPSRSGEVDVVADELSIRGQRVPAPGTTAIPERRSSGRRRQAVAPIRDSIDHEFAAEAGYELDQDIDRAHDDDRAPPPVRGPVSGPVVGGRAAMRAERQAADMARRKREKQTGSAVAVLDELDADGEGRKPRRVVKGLLAMTVVALGVLGVYSYVSPETKQVASQTATNAPAIVPDATAPLPELPSAPVDTPVEATTPVRAPLTVLNATKTTGMAAKASDAFVAAGWESAGVGGYTGSDVAASTVFFTEGDETQRQAALQLVDAFPQLQGPTPRFFELPAGVPAPGLVVVLAADWKQP